MRASLMLWCLLCVPASAKLQLRYFKANGCRPCMRFEREYASNMAFRAWLDRNFELLPAVHADRDARSAAQYGVSQYPTFIVLGFDGNEVDRVVGFTQAQRLADCLRAIGTDYVLRQQARQAAERPATPQTHHDRRDSEEANRKLRQQLDEALRANGLAIEDADRLHKRSEGLQAERDRLSRERSRLLAEKAELERRLNQSIADVFQEVPEDKSSPIKGVANVAKNIIGNVVAPDDNASPWASIAGKWGKAALMVAAPEVAVPVSVGLAAVGWLWRRRKQRQQERPTQRRQATPPAPQIDDWERSVVQPDGSTREEYWKQGVQAAADGHIDMLGGRQVGRAIERFVHDRMARSQGVY